MALAFSSGSNPFLSQAHSQDELGIELDGKKLFEKETFGGNGRTCQTCHSKRTGTLTLADVQRIIRKADPRDAFLIHDALDDDIVAYLQLLGPNKNDK
jgi:cytochrome c peroxidase